MLKLKNINNDIHLTPTTCGSSGFIIEWHVPGNPNALGCWPGQVIPVDKVDAR